MNITKLIIVALAAFTVGGTCPSDVNNDGTVGINDFLQLLGDWGPCPAPTVVDISADAWPAAAHPLVIRAWSNGYLEFKRVPATPWMPVPEDTGTSGTSVVGVTTANIFFTPRFTRYYVYVQWSNGETRRALYHSLDGWSSWETFE